MLLIWLDDLWGSLRHFAVVAVILVLSTIVPRFMIEIVSQEAYRNFINVQQELNKYYAVRDSTVITGWTKQISTGSGTTVTTYFNADVVLRSDVIHSQDIANQLAEIMVRTYPAALNTNRIQVQLRYGYNIGIWSSWNSKVYIFDPSSFNRK